MTKKSPDYILIKISDNRWLFENQAEEYSVGISIVSEVQPTLPLLEKRLSEGNRLCKKHRVNVEKLIFKTYNENFRDIREEMKRIYLMDDKVLSRVFPDPNHSGVDKFDVDSLYNIIRVHHMLDGQSYMQVTLLWDETMYIKILSNSITAAHEIRESDFYGEFDFTNFLEE